MGYAAGITHQEFSQEFRIDILGYVSYGGNRRERLCLFSDIAIAIDYPGYSFSLLTYYFFYSLF